MSLREIEPAMNFVVNYSPTLISSTEVELDVISAIKEVLLILTIEIESNNENRTRSYTTSI